MPRSINIENSDFQRLDLHGLTQVLEASAPGRLDCCGSWDLKAFTLPFEWIEPVTVNIAIEVRTRVRISAYRPGWLSIVSSEGSISEPADALPFNGPLGLPAAIMSHFGLSGARLIIESDIPTRSGLGGSAALAVAVIGAIATAHRNIKGTCLIRKMALPQLASELESIVEGSVTGLQDQAASVYGGVNQWTWRFSRAARPYTRYSLLPCPSYKELEKRIVVAFSGETRSSADVSVADIRGFHDNSTRAEWLDALRLIRAFGNAIHSRDWDEAILTLRRFASIRDRIGPNLWPPISSKLRDCANALQCATCTGGGNYGGCVWAFGPPEAILELRHEWSRLEQVRLLNSRVARHGLRVGTIVPRQNSNL